MSRSTPDAARTPSPGPAPLRRADLGPALTVFALVFGLFATTTGFEFLDVDDATYVFENPAVLGGLTAENLAWAFTGFHGSTWVPTTFVSLMLDRTLFGPDPWGFHLTNALLHALNAALLYLLVVRLTGRRVVGLVVALLFAVHPQRTEAVAWISARKDVLSTAFWLGTTLFWLDWIRTRRPVLLVAALLSFAAGLGAKQMLVTLPLTLLVLDAWPLRRKEPFVRRLVEKLPFFAVTLAGSVVAYVSQAAGTSVTTLDDLGVAPRVANALVGYAATLGRLLNPTELAYLYPHPSYVPPYEGWSSGAVAGSVAVLVALSVVAAWLARRGRPAFAAGWVWYLVTLLPVIGFVQIGLHANADRFSYVPHMGLLIGVVVALAEVFDVRRSWRRPALAVAAAVGLVWAGLTVRELSYWRDSESLFRRAIEVTDRNGIAMAALGSHLARTDRTDEALPWLERAVQAQPLHGPGHASLGIVLSNRPGDEERAADHLERALGVQPDDVRALLALGNVRGRQGRLSEARAAYREAAAIDPSRWAAHVGMARIARTRGNLDAAREHFTRALRAAPDDATRASIRKWMR